jgi:hypothetical protein
VGIRLIAEVMDHAPATLTHREAWVLGVLAADANDDSRTTWSSIESLEILHRARVSRPQMYEVLKSLMTKGALEKTLAGQKNAAAKYRIIRLTPAQCPEIPDAGPQVQGPDFPDTETPQCQQIPDTDRDSQCHVFPDTEPAQRPGFPDTDTSQCQQIPDTYSSKTEERDLSPRIDGPDPFDTWWTEYPRKVAKATARKAFTAALRAGANPAELTAAAVRHREHWQATGRQTTYIPHPATWLRAESWTDDLHTPEPPRPGPQQPQHNYAERGIF